MNKIIKGCIMGALSIGAFEFGFQLGKSYMLGILAKYNLSANELIEILSSYDRPISRFIVDVAKYFENENSKD